MSDLAGNMKWSISLETVHVKAFCFQIIAIRAEFYGEFIENSSCVKDLKPCPT